MKEKLNKRMRQGRVVIDKGSGKDAEQNKGILCMVKGLQRVLGLREVICPTSPSESGTGLSPVSD